MELDDTINTYDNHNIYEPADTSFNNSLPYYNNNIHHSMHNKQQHTNTAVSHTQFNDSTTSSRHAHTAVDSSIRRTESGKTIPDYALQLAEYPSQQHHIKHNINNNTIIALHHTSHSSHLPNNSISNDSESIESTDDDTHDITLTPLNNRRISNSRSSPNRRTHRSNTTRISDDTVSDDSESSYELATPASSSRKRTNKTQSNLRQSSNTKSARKSATTTPNTSSNKSLRNNTKSVPPANNDSVAPTIKCEQCSVLHTGWYGGGRFCTPKCARRYSIISRHSKRKSN